MGLREYFAMHRHWARHPPLELMVAAYLGIEGEPTPEQEDAELAGLLAGQGLGAM